MKRPRLPLIVALIFRRFSSKFCNRSRDFARSLRTREKCEFTVDRGKRARGESGKCSRCDHVADAFSTFSVAKRAKERFAPWSHSRCRDRIPVRVAKSACNARERVKGGLDGCVVAGFAAFCRSAAVREILREFARGSRATGAEFRRKSYRTVGTECAHARDHHVERRAANRRLFVVGLTIVGMSSSLAAVVGGLHVECEQNNGRRE